MFRILFSVVYPLLVILGCQSDRNSSVPHPKTLVQLHCSSCHKTPSAQDLDKQSWEEYILPRMSVLMDVSQDSTFQYEVFGHSDPISSVKNSAIFAGSQKISPEEFEAIARYIIDEAPGSLYAHTGIKSEPLSQFEVVIPQINLSPPSSTLLQWNSGKIFLGDVHSESLFLLNRDMEVLKQAKLEEGIVDLIETPEAYIICTMGSFTPSDQPRGKIFSLPKNGGRVKTLIDKLIRPVDMKIADLNQDGRTDIVVCEFGKWQATFGWWEQQADGTFKKNILRKMPGAIAAEVTDMNGDQLPDITALFGQGDEGVFHYAHLGKGSFEEQRWLTFPPSYGSSNFFLRDLDGDGDTDIVYTNGDNADFPPIVKPYHGIRYFANNGKHHFEESFFYPLPGAYGTKVEDFDMDGDLDLAAISFFPDYQSQDYKSFVYLQNQGDGQYDEQVMTNPDLGRWIIIESGDPDQDGDLDLFLGNLAFEVPGRTELVNSWSQNGNPFVWLRNTLR